jgi:hypothetical protein
MQTPDEIDGIVPPGKPHYIAMNRQAYRGPMTIESAE